MSGCGAPEGLSGTEAPDGVRAITGQRAGEEASRANDPRPPHGYVFASWFRNAASPASDTSTHFLSGAASAT